MSDFFIVLGFLILPLASTLIVLFSLWYIVWAINERDLFHFFRPKKVKKFLSKKGFNNVEDFVCLLFDTSLEDWERENDELTYYPFPSNKKLFFSLGKIRQNNVPSLSFFYNKRKLIVFDVRDENLDLRFLEDGLGEFNRQTFNLKGQRLSKRLFPFLQFHQQADEKTALREAEQKKMEDEHKDAEFRKWCALKEQALENLLITGKLWREREIDGFHLSVSSYQNVTCATFGVGFVDFVNVIWENDEITYEFLNENDEMCVIFKQNIEKIKSFCAHFLKSEHSKSGISDEPTDIGEVGPIVQQMEKKIGRLLLELEEEKEWLSSAEYHCITDTYPNDFRTLMTTYHRLKNPKGIEESVCESLRTMYDSLLRLSEKAELNKKQIIEKQNRLIQIRD